MRAVLYRVRSVLLRRFVATVVVTFIVAAVCGVVIAFGAGARRTSTAPDRYTASFGGASDALVTQVDRDKPRDGEVAALPGVRSVEAISFVFGGLRNAAGNDLDFSLVFTGSLRPTGLRLVDGRPADAGNEHEFVASRSFVERSHARLGDKFGLVTETTEQARQNGFDVTDPQGPSVSIELVGILDGASQLDDPTPLVVVSPALLREPDLGLSESLMTIDLEPGLTLATFRTELDTLPNAAGLTLEPGVLISQAVRSAVQAQARGLWVLAAVAAIASIAVLGQVMTRQVRPTQDDRHRLSSIGFTQSQIIAESVGRAAIPIAIGSCLGAALAVTGSGLFPLGFSKVLEPAPGVRLDWPMMIAGAGFFIVGLTLWTFAAVGFSTRPNRSARPSALLDAFATRASSATAAIGMRLAFSKRGRERGSVRGSVIGVVLSVAGVVAAVTFGVSLDRLVHQPFRYGSTYDAAIGDNGAETLPDGLADRLDADHDVTALTLLAGSQVRVGTKSIPILGLDPVRGDARPTILDGRLPAGDDEIAFGRVTARDIGAHVGDSVELAGPTRTQAFRVTGLAVVPGLGSNDGLGAGGIVTMGGLGRLDATALVTSAGVKLRVSRHQFFSSIPELAGLPDEPLFMPPTIVNVSRVRAIPYVLAAVLAALALLTVGHVMLTTMRSRRRDLAILRSLGADRSWITRAVHWQATLLTALPVIIGVPAGIVIGRLIFTAFADSMGAVDDAAIPVLLIAAGAAGVLVVANAVAAAVSQGSRRREPALLLQGE